MRAPVSLAPPRPLAILGRHGFVADLALRRVLHAKEREQALCVLDYEGVLASWLTEKNKGNLHRRPLLWCDLGNRRRPVAPFRFARSPGFAPALKCFLAACAEITGTAATAPAIDVVADLAWRLADGGTVGLAAILRGLRRPELSYGWRCNADLGDAVARLAGMIEWLLRFPGIWSASEGNNAVDLRAVLKAGGTVWIEIPGPHLERVEHRIVAAMAESAVLDALLSLAADEAPSRTRPLFPIVLYGFPPGPPLSFTAGGMHAKHVGLFNFSAGHSLPAADGWMEAEADCWIAGEVGRLPGGSRVKWLNEPERTRLKDLQPGEVWVRSGADGKAVTTLARTPDRTASLAQMARRQALLKLRPAVVTQFSSGLVLDSMPSPPNADIYRRLCTQDKLFEGWLRVKDHNRLSHGADQVTIAQFGTRLDRELAQLADELSRRTYRCRPLRTARIPKANGEVRVLKIACVRDRVVQTACLALLEPIFEPRFSPFSFGFRPHRSAHHAIAVARAMLAGGKRWAVTADIRRCFDTLDHEVLLRLLGDAIGDPDLLQLLRHWLVVDIIDFQDILPSELGVPPGEAISPLLANVYLDPLDKEFERNSTPFVRYADDYLVLATSETEARAALQLMADFLQGQLRLALKPAKTQYCHIADGVDYLGFRLAGRDIRIQEEKLARGRKAIEALLAAVAAPQATIPARGGALLRMNAFIRGFRNYFLIDDAPLIVEQLRSLDGYLDQVARESFPSRLAEELAWASRDRFAPDGGGPVHGADPNAAVAATGSYPEVHCMSPRADWITTGNAEDRITEPVPSPVPIADRGDEGEGAGGDIFLADGRMHVMGHGCYVTVSRDDLVVRRRRQEVFRTPTSALTLLYLEGAGIALSADLTVRLSRESVPVVFAPTVGSPAAMTQPVQGERSRARQQQVLRRDDPEILRAGLAMLAAKVGNQASVLKYFARYRKQRRDPVYETLTESARRIRDVADILGRLDPTAAGIRASAMGHEGRAAALYWSALAALLPAELAFPGRHTRHATDAVNSAINYAYGMLYAEVWRVLMRAGLDPYFGILHGAEQDQGSLVFDLIEEYRAPFGDRLILGMVGRGFMPLLDQESRLRISSRRKLADAFHKLWRRKIRWRGGMRAPADILERQAIALRNTYIGEDRYEPFKFRW